MNQGRFAGIVDGLAPGNVDNVTRHAGCGDKATALKVVQLGPVHRRPFSLLPTKVSTSSVRAIYDAVSVDPHQVVIATNIRVNKCLVTPRDARVRHKNVETSTKLADDSLDCFINRIKRGDVHLVCFA